MHALFWSVIPLCNGTGGSANLHFLLVLDESTACAPVGGTAVTRAVALDAILLTDLGSLGHGIAVAMVWSTIRPLIKQTPLGGQVTHIQPQPVR